MNKIDATPKLTVLINNVKARLRKANRLETAYLRIRYKRNKQFLFVGERHCKLFRYRSYFYILRLLSKILISDCNNVSLKTLFFVREVSDVTSIRCS